MLKKSPALTLAWLCLGLCVTGACSHSNIKADLDRGSMGDDDLVALLPRGLDAVLDVDVAGLRKLDKAKEILALVPSQAQKRLEVVVDSPLSTLDAIVVGLLGMGTPEAEAVWVARGNNDNIRRERVFSGIRSLGNSTEAEYHGLPIIETEAGQAAAILTPRTMVYGNRKTVRQVIDIFRNDEEGARRQEDLMTAFAKAPRAKEGRPAVMLGVLLSPGLRGEIEKLGLPELGKDADCLAAALAVGDGLDLGLVVGFHDLAIAKEAATNLTSRVQALKTRPALMFMGIEKFISPLVVVAVPAAKNRKTPELHLAYRLAGTELDELINSLSRLDRLKQRLRGDKG